MKEKSVAKIEKSKEREKIFLLADITNINIVGGQEPGVHEFLPTIFAH